MSDVVIAGATGLREIVIELNRTVHWVIWGVQGEAIIYADAESIFLFDLECSTLHKFVGDESYSSNEITKITRREGVVRVEVRVDVAHDVVMGLRPHTPFPALKRMFELSEIHPPTRARIRRLFMQA